LLDVEGSGSVPPAYATGSGKLRNIRIRIHKTVYRDKLRFHAINKGFEQGLENAFSNDRDLKNIIQDPDPIRLNVRIYNVALELELMLTKGSMILLILIWRISWTKG
jgi:hypothetical protein